MYVIMVRLRNALQGFGRNLFRFRDSSKDGNTFWLHQELKALNNYFALFLKSCIKYLCHRLTHTFKNHNTDEMLFAIDCEKQMENSGECRYLLLFSRSDY
jgi:hypothetical protein